MSVETDAGDGSYWEYRLRSDGKIIRNKKYEIESGYKISYPIRNDFVGPEFIDLRRQHKSIVDVETGDSIAGIREFIFQSRFDGNITIYDVFPNFSCRDTDDFIEKKEKYETKNIYALAVKKEG